jgi:hypothetical protein
MWWCTYRRSGPRRTQCMRILAAHITFDMLLFLILYILAFCVSGFAACQYLSTIIRRCKTFDVWRLVLDSTRTLKPILPLLTSLTKHDHMVQCWYDTQSHTLQWWLLSNQYWWNYVHYDSMNVVFQKYCFHFMVSIVYGREDCSSSTVSFKMYGTEGWNVKIWFSWVPLTSYSWTALKILDH